MRTYFVMVMIAGGLAVSAAPAAASHSWGGYHWGVTSTPFTLQLDNNLTTAGWRSIGATSAGEWSTGSSVLDAPLGVPQSDNKRCKASAGRVEVCNSTYGRNGWLGLAQIWLSGSHITQGTAKMNDTYLASASYSNTNRQHVFCQEIGHTFGLGHVDETGKDFNTCMDYADRLDNPSPNSHDFDQLGTIYGDHTDPSTTVASSGTAGSAQMRRVRDDVFVQDFGGGRKIYTFVFWADRRVGHGAPDVE